MVNLQSLRDRPDHVPLVWSHGMGVDSAAVAVKLVEWGLRPSLVLFADTGSESPDTYAYVAVMNEFLRSHGFPEVTVVKRRYKYASIVESCLAKDTLPDLAFGRKGCSLGWKVHPMDEYVAAWEDAKACFAKGDRVVRLIGYDFGERDSERFALSAGRAGKDPLYSYWYPLREARLDRQACKAVIRNAGLPVPPKSCCVICPAMKKEELRAQYRDHPELTELAVAVELNAVQGKHGLKSTKGLGRSFSWLEYLCKVSPRFDLKYGDWLRVLEDHRGRRYRYDKKGKLVEAGWGS